MHLAILIMASYGSLLTIVHTLLIHISVSAQYLPLEFLGVLVPELCSLAVQRGCTMYSQYGQWKVTRHAHLFGSPSKLCKLKSTVWILYAAVHLSFKMSKQILPEKSTLGW